MTEEQRETWRKYTGREVSAEAFQEAYTICGRRSGKSKVATLVATFLAAFKDYSNVLSPGETGTLMVIAVGPAPGNRNFQLYPGILPNADAQRFGSVGAEGIDHTYESHQD